MLRSNDRKHSNQMDDVMKKFVTLKSASPQEMYEFLSENPDFVTAAQVDIVDAKITAMRNANDKNATSLTAKNVILQYAVQEGIEIFFDSLCSNPPNEICLRFQATMKQKMSCSHSH